jgi:predicted porin
VKKTLIALATAGIACAASAQSDAQSSVTLFGVMDTAYTYGSGSLTHISRLTNSNWQSSRLGFRGTEDLGGGLRAIFWLEAAVNTDDGTGPATNSNNQVSGAGTVGGLTFGRASWVGLVGRFGDIRLGRDFAPHHLNYTYMDPWQTVGIAGSAVHMGRANGLAGWGALSNTGGVRVSNQIEYRTPQNLGGFFLHGSHFLGENPSIPAATSDDGTGNSLRAGYTNGPATVAVGWGQAQFGRTATVGDVKFRNIGASYLIGNTQVMGMWARDEFNTLTPFEVTGWLVGFISRVQAFEFRGSYSTSQRENSNNALNPEIRKLGLGVGYNFSKRTTLYTNVAYLKNSGGSAAALGAATTAPNASSKGLDIGIRHTF